MSDPLDVIIELQEKIVAIENKLALCIEAHESISKNGCCDKCQEARLVSLKALAALSQPLKEGRNKCQKEF